MIKDLINIALFKKDLGTVAREADLLNGILRYSGVIAALIIITLIISTMTTLISTLTTALMFGQDLIITLTTSIFAILGTIVVYAIMIIPLIILVLIISIIYFSIVTVITKILGGKGSYAKTIGSLFIVNAAIILTYQIPLQVIQGVLNILFSFLGPIGVGISGVLGLIFMIPALAITIITIYLESKVVAKANDISTLKGAIAVLTPMIIFIIIIIIIAVIILLFVGVSAAAIGASMMGSPSYF
jgi:hypothetical protein